MTDKSDLWQCGPTKRIHSDANSAPPKTRRTKWVIYLQEAGRIGPLPNRPSANRPPVKVGSRQIGPVKIQTPS